MTTTRPRGTLELARVRRRRRRRPAPPPGNGVAYLLEKLLAELRYAPHTCRSCGFEMEELAPGFRWCENCAAFGKARVRRQHVGSQIGRSS